MVTLYLKSGQPIRIPDGMTVETFGLASNKTIHVRGSEGIHGERSLIASFKDECIAGYVIGDDDGPPAEAE